MKVKHGSKCHLMNEVEVSFNERGEQGTRQIEGKLK